MDRRRYTKEGLETYGWEETCTRRGRDKFIGRRTFVRHFGTSQVCHHNMNLVDHPNDKMQYLLEIIQLLVYLKAQFIDL